MTAFIADEVGTDHTDADRLRRSYWQQYGATLTGMIECHGTSPDKFLDACHRLDLSSLTPDPKLFHAISTLPGRRLIHTNGPRAHAARVLDALGLETLFQDVIAIEDTGYRGKPASGAYADMLRQTGITPEHSVMIEDTPANLAEPHRLGMATVLVECPTRPTHRKAAHIHHRTQDLTAFLSNFGSRGGSEPD